MKAAIKFFHLPWREKRFFIKAAFLLLLIRLGLWVLPFRMMRRLLTYRKKAPAGSENIDRLPIDKIVRTVRAASGYVPVATCLTQALATVVLLSQIGYPARVRIGVVKSDEGRLQAHAWVESDGRIIIGQHPDLYRFSVLSPLREEIL